MGLDFPFLCCHPILTRKAYARSVIEWHMRVAVSMRLGGGATTRHDPLALAPSALTGDDVGVAVLVGVVRVLRVLCRVLVQAAVRADLLVLLAEANVLKLIRLRCIHCNYKITQDTLHELLSET
jgi:hypothetical protein